MSDIKINVQVLSKAAEASVGRLANEAKKSEKSFKNLNVSIKNSGSALKTFAGTLGAIGAAKAIGAIGRGFVALAGNIFESTIALETAAVQFEVLTGSAGAANAIIRDLQEFTARTPFQFEGVAKAAQRLLSFGFTTEEVKTNLQDLGDVAAASGADIGELSLIFGQVRAAGKLTGERLLQFQERAIPIGPALAKSLGVAESSIKDLVSSGAIDFKTFEEAFQSLNESGEFAFGGIEKRSQTLQGRISTLSDNFQLFAASIGERFAPALKVGVTILTEFIQSLGNNASFQGFIDVLQKNIPNAISVFATGLTLGIQLFNLFRIGANALIGTLFDVGAGSLLAAEKVLGFVASVGKFVGLDTSGIDQAKQSIEDLKVAAEETSKAITVDNEKIVISQDSLVTKIEAAVGNITTKYREEADAAAATADATVTANAKKAESIQQFRSLSQLFAEEELNRQRTAVEEADAFAAGQAEKDFLFLEKTLGEQEASRVAAQAQRLENEGKTDQALKVLRDARLKGESEETKRLAKEAADRVKNKADTLSTISTLQSSNNKTLATIGKAAALTQIAIDGPQAVTKALAAFPPPFNFAAAAAVGTAVAAQAARVSGLAFEDGGIVPGSSFSGDNVFARVNSGEMVLNRQQQSTLFDMANGASGSSSGTEITTVVQIGEEEVARAVSRQVANGLQLGEGGV